MLAINIFFRQENDSESSNWEQDENMDASKYDETAKTRNKLMNELFNQKIVFKDFLSRTFNFELKSRIENLLEKHANKTFKKILNNPNLSVSLH